MKDNIDLLRGEFIGKEVKVHNKKIEGRIIDETKNSFLINTKNDGRKRLLKMLRQLDLSLCQTLSGMLLWEQDILWSKEYVKYMEPLLPKRIKQGKDMRVCQLKGMNKMTSQIAMEQVLKNITHLVKIIIHKNTKVMSNVRQRIYHNCFRL